MKKPIITAVIFPLWLSILSGQIDTSQKYTLVGPEDFLTLIRFEEKAVLIDVRLPFEYRRGHIENSINIPIKLNHKKFIGKTAHIPKEKVILLYCESDVRSISVAQRMYDAGYRNICILEGGIVAWKKKILPLEGRRRKKPGGNTEPISCWSGLLYNLPVQFLLFWQCTFPECRTRC